MMEKYKFWTVFDRFWIHLPVGLMAVILYWLSPIAGAGFTFIFWRYEKNEDRYLRDMAWKDYQGFLFGMAIGGLIWTAWRYFNG